MMKNKILVKQISRSSLICRICGDLARGMNFDVMTCMSCTTFFRRNALRPSDTLRCKRQHKCQITIETRKNCAACRLQKCFVLGMNPQLIRPFAQVQTSTPHPLGLLRNDRSTLTREQWNLLSNITHVYDDQTIVNHIKYLLDEGSSLPLKIRTKPSFAQSCTYHCAASIKLLFERSFHFHTLPIDARQAFRKNNIFAITSLNGLFISREADLYDNLNFKMSCTSWYGSDFFSRCNVLSHQLDPNGIVIKLMLFVIAFSSDYCIIIFHNPQKIENTSNALNYIHIQDVFVTLLWKYLVYQYGFRESVIRYSSLIKTLLEMLSIWEESNRAQVFDNIMGTIVNETRHSLVIGN